MNGDPMTDAELLEIRQRNSERTQGEWKPIRSLTCGHLRAAHNYKKDPKEEWTVADMVFIGAAGQDITNLLAEVERLKGELKHCRQLLRDGQPPSEFSGMDTMKWSHYRRKQVEMLDQPNPEEVR